MAGSKAEVAQQSSDVLQRLRNIDPYEFEDFVGDLWEHQGWETTVSQSSNDQGVDVIAEKTDGIVDQKLAIQVKRYSEGNKVGRDAVQQYYAMKVQDAAADGAVIVTTSSFTTPAEDWADEHNVKLIDGMDLVDLIRENDAHALLDKYAPALRTADIDPVEDDFEEPTSRTNAATPDLPDILADDDTRQKIGGVGAVAGLVVIANPWGAQLPVEVLGTLLVLAAIAIWQFPETVWETVTPDRTVHREFSHGGMVVETSSGVKYTPPGDREDVEFDDSEDTQEQRQRASVYGALDGRVDGSLPETEPGVMPTEIASQGEDTIAAYRYAVHGDSPATIAGDMNATQQEVVDHLTSVANEQPARQ